MHFKNPERIKVFLKDPNKKNPLKIGKEIIVLWATKKELPLYYFKHLYKKEIENYRDYLGTREAARIHDSEKLHKPQYVSILGNKLNFALYCEKNRLDTPRLVGHNFGPTFFLEGKTKKVADKKALIKYYETIFGTANLEAIFFRPIGLYGGEGCFKLDRENMGKQLKAEYDNLMSGDYTHTAPIRQHPAIDKIHPHSINTLRILTFLNGDSVNVVSSFMRIGVGDSVVDNASSGGLFIGIYQEKGTLKRKGYRDLKFGGDELTRHPDSGFEFQNFKIPFFKSALELAIKAATHIADIIIGWDIAITTTGPTIIEGNERPDLFMSDVAYGGLLKNSRMKKIMAMV